MANFPIDPHSFTPSGFQVLQPWGADEWPARMFVTAAVPPPRRHESWAIAQVHPRPEDDEIDGVLNQVHDHIVGHLHWEVVSFAESAVGHGLFCMQDSSIRDLLVAQPAHHLGHGYMLTFVRHDEGENFRSTVYTRLSWLMMLNLPMDYHNEEFLRELVAKFVKMRGWIHDNPTPARTMVRCAYVGTHDVPRSMVIIEPQRYGGTVVSWTVPIYILTSEPGDVLPADESPEPVNGNPHPQFFVGHIPPNDNWIPPMDMNWDNWQNEGQGGNDHFPDGWDGKHQPQNPGADLGQQFQSSISLLLSDPSTSSIHLIPRARPEYEVVIQASDDVVEIEDITDEVGDDQIQIEHFDVEMGTLSPFNPLAIVPYTASVLHQFLQLQWQPS
ncbi:hypothetical protein ACQ4PT_006329 [Festuca glaucescens]